MSNHQGGGDVRSLGAAELISTHGSSLAVFAPGARRRARDAMSRGNERRGPGLGVAKRDQQHVQVTQ